MLFYMMYTMKRCELVVNGIKIILLIMFVFSIFRGSMCLAIIGKNGLE